VLEDSLMQGRLQVRVPGSSGAAMLRWTVRCGRSGPNNSYIIRSCLFNSGVEMSIYRQEGAAAYREFALALAEEQQVAYELSQCVKVDVYRLMAKDLYDRMTAAHAKTAAAFAVIQCFEHDTV
jgi:hypothetical protein